MSDLIGLVGAIGSGKDTVGSLMVEQPQWGFRRVSFAFSLKLMLSSVFEWDLDLLEGTSPHSREWREQVDPWWAQRLGIPNFTPRWALQHLGTDVMRNQFHPDIWLLSAQRRIEKLQSRGFRVVITDCRFANELQAIQNLGGQLIEVRRSLDRPAWFPVAVTENTATPRELLKLQQQGLTMKNLWPGVHESEWRWAGLPVSATVMNDGSIDDLQNRVTQLMQDLKIAS